MNTKLRAFFSQPCVVRRGPDECGRYFFERAREPIPLRSALGVIVYGSCVVWLSVIIYLNGRMLLTGKDVSLALAGDGLALWLVLYGFLVAYLESKKKFPVLCVSADGIGCVKPDGTTQLSPWQQLVEVDPRYGKLLFSDGTVFRTSRLPLSNEDRTLLAECSGEDSLLSRAVRDMHELRALQESRRWRVVVFLLSIVTALTVSIYSGLVASNAYCDVDASYDLHIPPGSLVAANVIAWLALFRAMRWSISSADYAIYKNVKAGRYRRS